MRASASSGDMEATGASLGGRRDYGVSALGNQMTRAPAYGFSSGMTTSLPDQLRATVRFLGRVLGDVIRTEDGEAVFNQIEETRQASVAFHRAGDAEAARALAERLEGLSLPETVRFAHSFACFLQITNIAEDHIQRRHGRGGDSRHDTLAGAVRTPAGEGVS